MNARAKFFKTILLTLNIIINTKRIINVVMCKFYVFQKALIKAPIEHLL